MFVVGALPSGGGGWVPGGGMCGNGRDCRRASVSGELGDAVTYEWMCPYGEYYFEND